MKLHCIMLLLFVFTTACHATEPAKEETKIETPKEYTKWLEETKKEMIKKGISKKTIKKVYADTDYYHPAPEVVKIDRKQLEFTVTSTDYLNRVVNEKRVKTAQEKYKELYPKYKDIEEKYGVGFHYIIAFWGIETNFGSTFGNHEVIDALTTLSYDERRRKFFTNELYEALKIIDKYDIDHKKMEGSWAGAMGNFQFMPSTFNAYAVDYDGDDMIDIWHNWGDAAASAAHYLSSIGWKEGTEWGQEVSLPWNFDYSHTGRNKNKAVSDWKRLGIKDAKGRELKLAGDIQGAIIIPEGKKGKAYLVLHNFHKIMQWNRSENYALAVGTLADYIKTGKKYQKSVTNPSNSVKTDDVLAIQQFINKMKIDKVDEDGNLGSQTREAIKKLQKKAKLPQDGYPDHQLINRINEFDPNVGFAVPVPEPKLKK